MKTKLVKHIVCAQCHSMEIVDPDCVCATENSYPTVTLEFETCACCGSIVDLPETEYNLNALKESKNTNDE